jgi:hypothetical protein
MLAPRLIAGAALALTAIAAAPAAASAAIPDPPKQVAYDVETSALGSYKLHDRLDDGFGNVTDETYNLDFSYTAGYQDVVFKEGRMQSVGVKPIQDVGLNVYDATIHEAWAGGGSRTLNCKPDAQISTYGEGLIGPHPIVGIGTENLAWRPAEHLTVLLQCDDDTTGDPTRRSIDLASPGNQAQADLGLGPLDLNWDVPYEALGKDYIEHLVAPYDGQTTGKNCPGLTDDRTVTCELQWSGKVVMRKVQPEGGGATGAGGGTGTVITPPATGQGTPQPPATPPVVPPAKPGTTVPSSTPAPGVSRARVARDRRHVTFTVTCPKGAACRGTATPKGGKAVRFSLPAGRSKAITVTLPRALRRGATATVSVAVTPKGGKPLRRTLRAR